MEFYKFPILNIIIVIQLLTKNHSIVYIFMIMINDNFQFMMMLEYTFSIKQARKA